MRWALILGFAAILSGVCGVGLSLAQSVLPLPPEELPEGVAEAGEFAPEGWTPGQPHPGQPLYEQFCLACHSMASNTLIGPGFSGLWQRMEEGPAHHEDPEKPIQQRILEYVKDVRGVQDPYFLERQQSQGPTPGVDMTDRGGLPGDVTDRQILDIIDYILRFRGVDFDEAEYRRRVRLGRSLVSGARSFRNGAPSCTGCHTAGAERALRGANVGRNIGGTFVIARERNVADDDDLFTGGLWDILSTEDAPVMHRYYRDGVGHLTDGEMDAVMTFFEHQLRQVGTERESNYLPIFALVLAALTILLIEPGLYATLFAKEEHEYIDGPYEEEHHHDEPADSGGYGSAKTKDETGK